MTSGGYSVNTGDDGPVGVENRTGRGGFIVVCDHATNHIPEPYAGLGLSSAELDSHIAWDIGALGLARALSRALDAPLVYPTVSRLLIDANRHAGDSDLIVEISDGVAIPGNHRLDAAERADRIARFHAPFHDRIEALIEAAPRPPALVAIHSFTPVFGGRPRPWQIGLVFAEDRRLSDPVLAALGAVVGLKVGINEPYGPGDRVYRTLELHGTARRLPTLMIEIRNDELLHERGRMEWAYRLAPLLEEAYAAIRTGTGPARAASQ